MSYAEEIDKSLEPAFAGVMAASQAIRDIDSQLLALAERRKYAIFNLETAVNGAMTPLFQNRKELYSLESAWDMFGMSSPSVREAVKLVRKTFFDDSLPEFRDTLFEDFGVTTFSEASCYSVYGCAYPVATFTFCKADFNPDSKFKIMIPAPGSARWSWRESTVNGKIIMVASLQDSYHNEILLAESFSHAEVAEAVKAFVLDPVKAIKEFGRSEKRKAERAMFAKSVTELVDALSGPEAKL